MSTSTGAEKKTASPGKRSGKTSKSAAPKKEAGKLARVKAPLNLREEAGYDQKIIRILPPGEPILLQGQELNGFAAAVTRNGEKGWVCTEFIETESVEVSGNV